MFELLVAVVALTLAYTGWKIMIDFARLNAALVAIAASVTSVAEAIRNPQVDNQSQTAVDEIASRLEATAAALTGLAAEETALDTVDRIEAEPLPVEPIEPTVPAPTDPDATDPA